ncbi:hypothetical protein JCM8547_005684 [Rhodosporidiobolus lusitaniae]
MNGFDSSIVSITICIARPTLPPSVSLSTVSKLRSSTALQMNHPTIPTLISSRSSNAPSLASLNFPSVGKKGRTKPGMMR